MTSVLTNWVATLPQAAEETLDKYLKPLCMDSPAPPEPLSQWKGVTTAERAALIYAKLTSHRFCRRRPADIEKFTHLIEQAIAKDAPIPFVLGHGPLKNPNNAPHQSVDWAELFAYAQLMRLHQAVQVMHAPGLSITILMDDTRAAYANGVPAQWMDAYTQSVRSLLAKAPFKSVFNAVTPISTLPQITCIHQSLERAHHEIALWANNPNHTDELATRTVHALRNRPALLWPEGMTESERFNEAKASVLRYMAYHHAEQAAGIWSQPDTLYMRYSAHPGHYHIYTLRRGSVSQPWQGQGALVQLGNGQWDVSIKTGPIDTNDSTTCVNPRPEWVDTPLLLV